MVTMGRSTGDSHSRSEDGYHTTLSRGCGLSPRARKGRTAHLSHKVTEGSDSAEPGSE